MTKLSVNVNKIATLRNARGENNPDVVKMALLIEDFGADGITVHPRPDERHIKFSDVFALKKAVRTEFNVEGYPSDDFIALMHQIRPDQITLVPDSPHVLTSNAGFTLKEDLIFVQSAISALKSCGARVSIFIDPADFVDRDVEVIAQTGADRIELYTKDYADNPHDAPTLARYKDLAQRVKRLGLKINAGHDLSLENLSAFLREVAVDEVSIGHAIICDALILGMRETISRYKAITASAHHA